ncbi:MAG: acyltransferase family protein [Lachnospiraceae bacterium]|nr:acyltransferase family protein [Lachnospiraceae bacterium]
MLGERIRWVDIAKGIAIILVVVGHTASSSVREIIYIFHMPLLFLLSGYTMKSIANMPNYVKKSAKKLLIPYLIISVVFIGHYLLQKGSYSEFIWSMKRKPATILWAASGAILDSEGNLASFFDGICRTWFLPTLFCARIMVGMIYKIKIKSVDVAIVLAMAAIGYVLGVSKLYLPLSFDIATVAVLFLYLGNLLSKVKAKIYIFISPIAFFYYAFSDKKWDKNTYGFQAIW